MEGEGSVLISYYPVINTAVNSYLYLIVCMNLKNIYIYRLCDKYLLS